ncbi:glycosyltransferase [Chamaesiphon minutus]|nr:glycosyltransferase [Chamaesiphon minutus]
MVKNKSLKMTIVSDYLFYKDRDGNYWSEVPWDLEFTNLFAPNAFVYLVGKVKNVDTPNVIHHLVDCNYYEVLPLSNWTGLRQWLKLTPEIIRTVKKHYHEVDVVILKLFYLNSVLVWFCSRFWKSGKQPVLASLLVGDSEEAFLLRDDVVSSSWLRSGSAKLVKYVISLMQYDVDVAGFVAEFLHRKFAPKRQDVVISNESWLKEWMFSNRSRSLHDRPTRILFVGRLIDRKRIYSLTETVIDLIKSGRNIHLTIVGDGVLMPAIKELIATHQLQAHFTLTGWLRPLSPELIDCYREHDIFCLPSYAEGLPLVILEAMANGVATIATDVSGIPEIIRHEQTGLLIPRDDKAALNQAICRYLDEPELWRKCIDNGYEVAKQNSFVAARSKFANAVMKAIEHQH